MALTTELRIFPDKELFAVDMAELLDSAVMFSGVIQGCGVTFNSTDGTLTVETGRIILRGRLGVITERGTISPPTLTGTSNVTCYLVAACNLSSTEDPFTVDIVEPATYEEYQQRKTSTADNFNTQDGFDFITLGSMSVNPASGKIVSWSPSADATTKDNTTMYNDLVNRLNTISNSLSTLNTHDSSQSIRAVTATLGSMAFDSTGAINRVVSVASAIPAGYSAIAAIPFASGSYAAYFYLCGMETGTSVRVQLFRGEWTSVTQTNPSVVLICVRNL